MAIGMLVASPLAGIYADRHGSRALAALGMLLSAIGLAGMTMLQANSSYRWSALWLALVGIGSGMFNSPEHRRDDGRRPGAPPRHRRRRTRDAAEHRRRHLDRFRDGDRHRRCAEGRAVQDLLRPHIGSLAASSCSRSSRTCTWRSGCSPGSRSLGAASRCCARRTCVEYAEPASSSRPRDAPDRRDRGAQRRHPAHDPLLRGARASAAVESASWASTACTPRRTSSASAS